LYHPRLKARLDISRRAWQPKAVWLDKLSQESLRQSPRSVTRPGYPLLGLRKKITRQRRCLDDGPHACGADDAGAISANVQKNADLDGG
jgi:hypothetical protein